MSLQGYGKYSSEALDAEEAELAKTFGTIYKWKVGRNPMRVLPPLGDNTSPFKLVHVHFMEMGELTIPIVCPKRMANQPCPICAQADKLRKSGDAVSYEKARRYFPSRKWYANALDRNAAEGDELVMISCGKEIMSQVNSAIKTRREEDANFDLSDPYEGVDMVVTRKGTIQEDTEYTVSLRTAKTPMDVSDEAMQGFIDTAANLNDHATPLSAADILDKLRELAGGARGSRQQSRPVRPAPAPRRSIADATTTAAAVSGEEPPAEVADFFNEAQAAEPVGYDPVDAGDEDIPF